MTEQDNKGVTVLSEDNGEISDASAGKSTKPFPG